MTEQLQHIPLNKLVPWDGNVRRTAGADTALAELAASIAAHGLLQSLVVRKDRRGKYAVVAGGRRLQALQKLAEDGSIEDTAPVPCRVLPEETDATEVSLAENTVREAMHPADEFEAFRELADKGLPSADIAARFGVSETVVQKRLKLARVSPVIIEAFRRDELTLESVMAFAASDDPGAQERLWKEAPAWLRSNPRSIRDALTETEITAKDPRTRFVGLKAYQKAGGVVRRDLFSDGDDGVFIADVPLLESLVLKKLGRIAKAVSKEGWKWVETRPAFDYAEWSGCERRYPEPLPLSDEEAAELAALEAEADAIYNAEEQPEGDGAEHLEAIEKRIGELSEREEVWEQETLAIGGAVVTVGRDGKPRVERGFIRAEDLPEAAACQPDEINEAGGDGEATALAFPAALIESLTAQKSAALSAEVVARPDIALAAVVHAVAMRIFYGRGIDTCLQLSAFPQAFRKAEGTKALEVIEAARAHWAGRIPPEPEALWTWCLEQEQPTLLGLLAFCAACVIDAVVRKGDCPACGRLVHAGALAAALDLDMAAWFVPGSGNYFGRISKAQIIEALQEAKNARPAPAWTKLKKGELAALAEREIAGTGWLPEILRRAA